MAACGQLDAPPPTASLNCPVLSPIFSARHAEEIQQRELQVRQRRVLRIDEMTAALERAAAAADEQRRERTVRVTVAVADARTIKNDHVVEQRAVAVRRVPQLLQIIREQLQVVLAES